jgi:hypothetical protein
MTAVFNTPRGPLAQVQIGLSDVLATISTATSAIGWLGGLDGVHLMLSKAKGYIGSGNETHYTNFEDIVEILPQLQDSSFHILTSDHGPVWRSMPNADKAFGGGKITQIIGTTICALAHELGGPCAIDLFIQFLGCKLFKDAEMIGALHSKLLEDDVLPKLLNEGVTRGLPELFLKSVTSIGLPNLNSESYYGKPHTSDPAKPVHSDLSMVAGLLKWITQRKRDPYLTRSSLVARIAGYLKLIGYNIGSIQLWDGSPPISRASGPNALILVLGGSEETDYLMTEPANFANLGVQLHYTFHTVGSILHQALAPDVMIRSEILQTEFEFIFNFIESHLNCSYRAVSPPQIPESIEATFIWSDTKELPSPIELTLASTHFSMIAKHIAPCYSRIASDKLLKRVTKSWNQRVIEELTEDDARFRTTTAAIIICLVSRLCSTDFTSVRHSVSLELFSKFGLDQICKILNRGLSSSLSLNEAAGLAAVVHTGIMDLWRVLGRIESSDRIIGWRNGMYCVLPSLLLNMEPSASSVALACKDVFYANLRTHRDGSIRDSDYSSCMPELKYLRQNTDNLSPQSAIATFQSGQPWIGPAVVRPPNRSIYLNIERPMHLGESDICFAGRLDGNIISIVSVVNVLASIARSLEVPKTCSHNDAANASNVLNINTSTWLEDRSFRPAGTAEIPAYLAIHDSPAWAVFAAGECANFHHSIVFGCQSCAKEALVRRLDHSREECVVLIGFK